MNSNIVFKTRSKSTAKKRLSKTETLMKILSSKIDDPLTIEVTPRRFTNSSYIAFSDENIPPLKYTDKDENIKSMKHSDMTKLASGPCKKNVGSFHEIVNSKKIQDDLNSPSANSRMRAIKALRSPGTNNYLFDIPHEEQPLITEEDKPQSLPKLEDVFKKIIVYVEVRTEEDNRSAGIKEVIKIMGAKINNNLLRDTTHVVFKDGLLSTYTKAKNWNIPIVSILWIEACKRNLKIIDPKLYPISNLDRYENPELYKKMRRVKSMQPDAEDKRNKIKITKKTEVKVKIQPSVRVPRKPKDKLNEIFAEFHEKLIATPETNDDYVPFKSKLLERIKNSPFVINKNYEKSEDDDFQLTPKNSKTESSIVVGKKKLEFDSLQTKDESNFCGNKDKKKAENLNLKNDKPTRRRHTLSVPKKARTPPNKISKINNITIKKSPKKGTKRQTQIFQHFSIEKEGMNSGNEQQSETEKDEIINNVKVSLAVSHADATTQNFHPIKRRRTLYSTLPMEITTTGTDVEHNIESEQTIRDKYVLQDAELGTQDNNSAQTPKNLKSVIEEHKNTLIYSSDRMINRRRTIFDISMEIIDKRLQNINEASKIQTPKIDRIVEENIVPDPDIEQFNTDNNSVQPTTICSDNNNNISNNTPTIPRKRKLFAPNDFMSDTLNVELPKRSNLYLNDASLKNDKRNKKENVKDDLINVRRRRTIGGPNLGIEKNATGRRSSADFQIKNVSDLIKVSAKPKAARYVIVSTNMHTEQINFMKRATEILNFSFENEVTDQTTHVISLEPGRTINLLKGLIRGLWILKYDWIIESVNQCKFVEEEPYELRSFSDAVEICRSERQAFGENYKMDLFSSLMPIYLSKESNVPYDSLKELIRLCSGKIIDNKEKAKYIIGEYYNAANKICVQPQWILDSITNKKLQKYTKYQIKL